MALGIFVSATSRDMDPDCRPAVLEAIDFADVASISMETWMADYRDAVTLCKQKLSDSTHYVGVFGYWRGWVPDGETGSITEIEYREACAKKPRASIALFLPQETSAIGETLWLRAARLHAEDLGIANAKAMSLDDLLNDARIVAALDAQETFLRRVRAPGVVEHFDSPWNLSQRVGRRARAWTKSIRAIGREGTADDAAAGVARAGVPGDAQLAELGREPQQAAFRETLRRMAVSAGPEVACVVVHGPAQHGQERLARRLLTVLESSAATRPAAATVSVGAVWRKLGVRPLLDVLGAQLELGAAANVADLASRIDAVRARSDVAVTVLGVQQYPDALAGFLDTFWAPLVAALDPAVEHRLVCIATVETAVAPRPAAADGADHDPARPVVLPALAPFERDELALWLRAWLSKRAAVEMADLLIDATGGVPGRLYAELANPSNWTAEER